VRSFALLRRDRATQGAIFLSPPPAFDPVLATMREAEASINMIPNGVFNPYTGIKTNLLFFTKGEPTKTVWYYEHTYPKGVKSYNKTRPIDIKEFAAIEKWWGKDTPGGRARRKESPFAWQVSLDDIKARNYNLDIKNPNAEAAKHGDPDKLLADYKKLLADVAAARDALRDELEKALVR